MLVYNQPIGTLFIQKHLITAKFLTINPRQHLLSNRKKKSEKISRASGVTSEQIHRATPTPNYLTTQRNLSQLLRRNRSKVRKKLPQHCCTTTLMDYYSLWQIYSNWLFYPKYYLHQVITFHFCGTCIVRKGGERNSRRLRSEYFTLEKAKKNFHSVISWVLSRSIVTE